MSSDVNRPLQIQVDSSPPDGPDPYHYAFTYEKATLYEYKYDRAATPDPVNPCYRCNRRVQPGDGINIGVLFHKQCFRCRICGTHLSMQTFHRKDANMTADKEVYCKFHVSREIGQVEKGDPMPVIDNPSPNTHQYIIQIDGRIKAPASLSPAYSPSSTHSIPRANSSNSLLVTQRTPKTLTKTTYHSRPPLQSYEDFVRLGVFDAQYILEQRHQEEENRLQRFLSEERERELKKLEGSISDDMEQAAAQLLSNLDPSYIQRNSKALLQERERLMDHFNRERDERMKQVIERIAFEEKTRQSKLTEKHGEEMMLLIAEKDREADTNALLDHSVQPPVRPSKVKKSQLYSSPIVFERIDQRALELASRDYVTYTDLVRDLTQDCSNELEKARALFRWVVARDLGRNKISDVSRPHISATLLKNVKSGKELFHQLFKRLCSYAGLYCEIILGCSKGSGFKPGMKIDSGRFRNSWTAVCIDGSWHFVNCTWAARHVTGHREELPDIYKTYDEFYFLTDPEDYIYQHYPDDGIWQLLEIPLPFSEFVNLPVVKSPFFNYGLKFYSNYGATLSCDSGITEIRLVCPSILGFGSLLEAEDNLGNSSQIDGRTLLRLVKNEAIFTISLPKPGVFYFTIFIGDYWQSECLETGCSFVIDCKHIPGISPPPYPPVPYYGPTPLMNQLGITPTSHSDPLIIVNGQNLEVSFCVLSTVKITHTLQFFDTNDSSINDVDRYVFLRSRDDRTALYNIRCSTEGYFIFSLFAADPTADSLDCVYRYLIVCQQAPQSVGVFPKTFHRWNKCLLHEPQSGDLLCDKRYVFRLEVPNASEVFVVLGDVWHHLKHKIGNTWESSIHTGKASSVLKVYSRYPVNKDSSIFAHLLDYEVVENGETEI